MLRSITPRLSSFLRGTAPPSPRGAVSEAAAAHRVAQHEWPSCPACDVNPVSSGCPQPRRKAVRNPARFQMLGSRPGPNRVPVGTLPSSAQLHWCGRQISLSRPYSECSVRRQARCRPVDQHRILISEVVMARMLIEREPGLKTARGDAGMAAHAMPDHRDLGDVVAASTCRSRPRRGLVDHVLGALELGLRHREGHVGRLAVLRDVLHIMSTLMLASASGTKRPRRRPACPARGATLICASSLE